MISENIIDYNSQFLLKFSIFIIILIKNYIVECYNYIKLKQV